MSVNGQTAKLFFGRSPHPTPTPTETVVRVGNPRNAALSGSTEKTGSKLPSSENGMHRMPPLKPAPSSAVGPLPSSLGVATAPSSVFPKQLPKPTPPLPPVQSRRSISERGQSGGEDSPLTEYSLPIHSSSKELLRKVPTAPTKVNAASSPTPITGAKPAASPHASSEHMTTRMSSPATLSGKAPPKPPPLSAEPLASFSSQTNGATPEALSSVEMVMGKTGSTLSRKKRGAADTRNPSPPAASEKSSHTSTAVSSSPIPSTSPKPSEKDRLIASPHMGPTPPSGSRPPTASLVHVSGGGSSRRIKADVEKDLLDADTPRSSARRLRRGSLRRTSKDMLAGTTSSVQGGVSESGMRDTSFSLEEGPRPLSRHASTLSTKQLNALRHSSSFLKRHHTPPPTQLKEQVKRRRAPRPMLDEEDEDKVEGISSMQKSRNSDLDTSASFGTLVSGPAKLRLRPEVVNAPATARVGSAETRAKAPAEGNTGGRVGSPGARPALTVHQTPPSPARTTPTPRATPPMAAFTGLQVIEVETGPASPLRRYIEGNQRMYDRANSTTPETETNASTPTTNSEATRPPSKGVQGKTGGAVPNKVTKGSVSPVPRRRPAEADLSEEPGLMISVLSVSSSSSMIAIGQPNPSATAPRASGKPGGLRFGPPRPRSNSGGSSTNTALPPHNVLSDVRYSLSLSLGSDIWLGDDSREYPTFAGKDPSAPAHSVNLDSPVKGNGDSESMKPMPKVDRPTVPRAPSRDGRPGSGKKGAVAPTPTPPVSSGGAATTAPKLAAAGQARPAGGSPPNTTSPTGSLPLSAGSGSSIKPGQRQVRTYMDDDDDIFSVVSRPAALNGHNATSSPYNYGIMSLARPSSASSSGASSNGSSPKAAAASLVPPEEAGGGQVYVSDTEDDEEDGTLDEGVLDGMHPPAFAEKRGARRSSSVLFYLTREDSVDSIDLVRRSPGTVKAKTNGKVSPAARSSLTEAEALFFDGPPRPRVTLDPYPTGVIRGFMTPPPSNTPRASSRNSRSNKSLPSTDSDLYGLGTLSFIRSTSGSAPSPVLPKPPPGIFTGTSQRFAADPTKIHKPIANTFGLRRRSGATAVPDEDDEDDDDEDDDDDGYIDEEDEEGDYYWEEYEEEVEEWEAEQPDTEERPLPLSLGQGAVKLITPTTTISPSSATKVATPSTTSPMTAVKVVSPTTASAVTRSAIQEVNRAAVATKR